MTARNLPTLFLKQAYQHTSRDFLRAKRSGAYHGLSWTHTFHEIMAASLALMAEGVSKGGAAAILSENRPEWILADLAILSSGAATVPIYATSTAAEISYILKHSDAKVLFVSNAEQAEKVKNIKAECPLLKRIVSFDAITAEKVTEWTKWLEPFKGKADEKAFEARIAGIQEADLASIIYTSGTTGPPKGVMLTHGNFIANCESCKKAVPVTAADETLSFLPLSHVFERLAGYYYAMVNGGTINFAERMDTVPENLVEVRPTLVCSVPRLFEKIYTKILEQVEAGPPLRRRIFCWAKSVLWEAAALRLAKKPVPAALAFKAKLADRLVAKKIQKKMGGRLRFFISGGAALPKEIGEFFYAFGILVLEGYGLTETSPVIAVNTPEAFKFGVVGRPLPGVEVKIAEDGEILVRGPSVMKGYFKADDATREAIHEGWFYTGDIGLIDADGFLKITDRKKDIIVTSGGKNISPQNIEQTLLADPLIAQVCVCGDDRRYVTALIVPQWAALQTLAVKEGWDGRSRDLLLQDERVIAFYRKRIDELMADFPHYSRIKYFSLLPEEFSQAGGEMTPTLKLKRKIIFKKYAHVIDRMYAPHLAGDAPV